jgi:hypothetical protein
MVIDSFQGHCRVGSEWTAASTCPHTPTGTNDLGIKSRHRGPPLGGQGSGSTYHWWRPTKKRLVEDCLTLEADRWTREKILAPGVHHSGRWVWRDICTGEETSNLNYEVCTLDMDLPWLRLAYSIKGQSLRYLVGLTTTRLHFGGLRWWTSPGGPVSGRSSTSRPGAWKAHGPASEHVRAHIAGHRGAESFQAAVCARTCSLTAGLKQPSPRSTASHSLGRRNAALLQGSKLESASQTASIYRAGIRAATRSGVRSAGRRRRGVVYRRRLWWGSGAPATFLGVGGRPGLEDALSCPDLDRIPHAVAPADYAFFS